MVVLAVKLSFYFQQFIDLLGITDDLDGAKIAVNPPLTYFSKHIWWQVPGLFLVLYQFCVIQTYFRFIVSETSPFILWLWVEKMLCKINKHFLKYSNRQNEQFLNNSHAGVQLQHYILKLHEIKHVPELVRKYWLQLQVLFLQGK